MGGTSTPSPFYQLTLLLLTLYAMVLVVFPSWSRGKHLPWFPVWALSHVMSYTRPSQAAACDTCAIKIWDVQNVKNGVTCKSWAKVGCEIRSSTNDVWEDWNLSTDNGSGSPFRLFHSGKEVRSHLWLLETSQTIRKNCRLVDHKTVNFVAVVVFSRRWL